jgi:hypothetical protein
MSSDKLPILPKTRVGELLEAYPQLEEVLFSLSPAFSSLKNPILRRTVGRVATLTQAAAVGGLKVDELVNRLRSEVGQAGISGSEEEDDGYIVSESPDWFSSNRIADRFDATPVINDGGSPMAEILQRAGKLENDQILEVRSPFVPAPVLDMLRKKGYKLFALKTDNGILSYVGRG